MNRAYENTITVLFHSIVFWYNCDYEIKFTDEIKANLDSEVEERVKTMINDGYSSGELCYYDGDLEIEFRGWWKINNNN